MSKTPITWLELINQKLSAMKKAGKTASIREVAPEAKAEWTKIKAGTHPDYTQGKAKTHARKHKKDKTQKVSSSKNNSNDDTDAEVKKILATLKLCGKCSKQVNKLTKDQKGGACTSFAETGPQPQPNTTQQLAIVEKDVQPIESTSTLANAAEAVTLTTATQKGGNCGACSLTGGKKSKKNKSKKNKSRHTKKK